MSQATKWRACGWKNPRNPRASFAWKAAALRSELIPSGLLCESGVPGIQLSSRTMWRLPSSAAIHSRSLPLVDAITRGTGKSGRVTLQMAECRDLEIDGAFALAAGGDLQDIVRAIRSREPMVLVALAIERRELAVRPQYSRAQSRNFPSEKDGGLKFRSTALSGRVRATFIRRAPSRKSKYRG